MQMCFVVNVEWTIEHVRLQKILRMSSHHRAMMAAANRDVSELSREELEALVMEMNAESESRSLRIHKLREQVTVASTKVKAVESSVQDQCLDYIVPPSALRPSFAQGYAALMTDSLDSPAVKDTSEVGEPPESPRKYEPRTAGSYNPYQGANRRIVSLRQKIGDLQQQIVDTHKETEELHQELERLRALLEKRKAPTGQPFRHEKPIPKFNSKKGKITLKRCVKYCEELLKREKDPQAHDELLCVYYLLTSDDVLALELFGHLLAPDMGPDDMDRLDEILKDRDAQVSILREQYRHLLARHEPLRDAFRDLKSRMPDHLVDNSDVIAHLKDQIAALQKLIDGIPDLVKEIEDLKKRREELLNDKERLFAEGSAAAGEVDAELRRKLAELSEDKAGVERERRQLEEVDKRIRERYTTMAEELRRMKEDEMDLKRLLDEREAKKREMHRKLTMLQNAGIKTPQQVRAVIQRCYQEQPDFISRERHDLIDECNALAKKLRDLKRDCMKLKQVYQDKQHQQRAYEDRVNRGRHALAGF